MNSMKASLRLYNFQPKLNQRQSAGQEGWQAVTTLKSQNTQSARPRSYYLEHGLDAANTQCARPADLHLTLQNKRKYHPQQ